MERQEEYSYPCSTILIHVCLVCNKYYKVVDAEGAMGGESHGCCSTACEEEYLSKYLKKGGKR